MSGTYSTLCGSHQHEGEDSTNVLESLDDDMEVDQDEGTDMEAEQDEGMGTGAEQDEEDIEASSEPDISLDTDIPSKTFRVLSSRFCASSEESMHRFLKKHTRDKGRSSGKWVLKVKVKTLMNDQGTYIIGVVVRRIIRKPVHYVELWFNNLDTKSIRYEWLTIIATALPGETCICLSSEFSSFPFINEYTDFSFTQRFAKNLLDPSSKSVYEIARNNIVGLNTSKVSEKVTGRQLSDYENDSTWINCIVSSFSASFLSRDDISENMKHLSGISTFLSYSASINSSQVTLIPSAFTNSSLQMKDTFDILQVCKQITDSGVDITDSEWDKFFFFQLIDDPQEKAKIDKKFKDWFNSHFWGDQTCLLPSEYSVSGVRLANSECKLNSRAREVNIYNRHRRRVATISLDSKHQSLRSFLEQNIKPPRPASNHLRVSIGNQKKTEPLVDWIECVISEPGDCILRISKKYYRFSKSYLNLVKSRSGDILTTQTIYKKRLNELGFPEMPFPSDKKTRTLIKEGKTSAPNELNDFGKKVWDALVKQKKDGRQKLDFEGEWNRIAFEQLKEQGKCAEIWFGDKNLTSSAVELFDIGFVLNDRDTTSPSELSTSPRTVYFLHVKTEFSASAMRAVCGQILGSATDLKSRLFNDKTESSDNGVMSEEPAKAIRWIKEHKPERVVFVCVIAPTKSKKISVDNAASYVPHIVMVQSKQSLESTLRGVPGIDFVFEYYGLSKF